MIRCGGHNYGDVRKFLICMAGVAVRTRRPEEPPEECHRFRSAIGLRRAFASSVFQQPAAKEHRYRFPNARRGNTIQRIL